MMIFEKKVRKNEKDMICGEGEEGDWIKIESYKTMEVKLE